VSSARSLAAYFGMLKVQFGLITIARLPSDFCLKVSHMLITGSFIQRLLFPKRIAGVVAVCCCMFVLFLAIFSSRIQTRLNAPTGDFVVFSAAMYAIAAALAISVHCIDACCDCLLQERKARAQTTRKLVSIVGSCVAVALLILPDRYFLIPVIVFACLTAILGALLSLLWWFLPENAEVTFQKMKFRSSAVLPARFIGVIIFAAVIGDNADQVLDAVANVQIDSFVSGGKVKYVNSGASFQFCFLTLNTGQLLPKRSQACLHPQYRRTFICKTKYLKPENCSIVLHSKCACCGQCFNVFDCSFIAYRCPTPSVMTSVF